MSSEDKDDKKAEEKTGNGKWWEFYIVRYALGTVFGVLIVNFLVGSGLAIPFPNGNISDITKPEGLPLLLGYGLAYCYLASAPILVFHAGRFAMKRTGFQTATVISIVISAVVAGAWAAWAVSNRIAFALRPGLPHYRYGDVSHLSAGPFAFLRFWTSITDVGFLQKTRYK